MPGVDEEGCDEAEVAWLEAAPRTLWESLVLQPASVPNQLLLNRHLFHRESTKYVFLRFTGSKH